MVELISEIETKLVGAPSDAMDMSAARETSRTPIFGYSIIANDALPVENYCAVVTLTDGGNHTAVTYGSNWFPKGATEKAVRSMLEGFYNGVLDYMEGLATADPGDRAPPQQ